MTERKRHWSLTALLILIVVREAGIGLSDLTKIINGSPSPKFSIVEPAWLLAVTVVLAPVTIAFVIALLKWKRWGFWGLCCVSVLKSIANALWVFSMTGINVRVPAGASLLIITMPLWLIMALAVLIRTRLLKDWWTQLV